VKPIRDSVAEALQLWKCIPDVVGDYPSAPTYNTKVVVECSTQLYLQKHHNLSLTLELPLSIHMDGLSLWTMKQVGPFTFILSAIF
jgi:hypothetical protein